MVINHTAVLSSGRVIYADSVKTKSSYRTLPLSDSLRRYLTDLRRRQNANRKKYGKATARAITSAAVRMVRRSGRITFRVSSSGCAAVRACRASGFTILRHSVATILLQQGFFAQADSGLAGAFGFFHHGEHLRPSGLQFETLFSTGDGERNGSSRSG